MPSWKKLLVSGSDATLNSLSVTQDVTAAGFSGSFSGSFQGDGSGLTGILFDIGDAASFSAPFTSQLTVDVVHSLNSEFPFVQVYDTDDELFIPLSVKVIDANTIRVTFSESTSGIIMVAKGGHIIQGTAANADLLNGEPGSYYLDYNNFTNLPPAGDSFPYTGSAIITGSLNVIGPISSSGNIVPTTATQDLGTVTSPWRELFVSTASIKFSDGVETVKTLTSANIVTTESLASQLPSGIVSSSNQIESILNPILNGYATTGSNIFYGTQVITGSLFVSDNLVVQGQTALEFITASAVSIGTNIIILNEDTPAVRYAGLAVYDSGSTNVTASFLWDGLNNQWVFEFEEPGETPDSSVALFGPLSESGLGTERGLFNNYVLKVEPNDHGHHLIESKILDTGTKVSIDSNTEVTGSFRADTYLNLPAGIISGSEQISANIRTERLEMGVHFPGDVISVGAKGRKTFGQSGTIIGWKLISDTSTSTVVDVWKTNNAIPTNSNSITGTAKPTLSSAQLNSSSTLTGWTTSVTAGDIFILEVESNNNASYLYLEIDILLT
jgi:hypothetical protein